MGEPFGSYSPELAYMFYTLYVASIDLITPVGQRDCNQPLFPHNWVRGPHVDISE